MRVLFNAQVALRYASPAMSLTIAVDMTLLMIYFLKRKTIKKKDGLRTDKFVLVGVVALTFLSYLLSSIFAIVPISVGLTNIVKYFSSNFGMLFLLFKCLNTKEDLGLYVKMGAIVAVLITMLGVYEIIFRDNPWLDFVYLNSLNDETTRGRSWYVPPFVAGELQIRMGLVRAFSFFGIHIGFGTTCVFLAFLYFTIKKYKFDFINKTYLIIVVALLFVGTIISNSKTSFIGVAILLLGFYKLHQIFNPKILFPAIIIGYLIVVYVPVVVASFMSLFDPKIAEELGGSSVQMREMQLNIAMEMFNMNPLFGNGVGAISIMKNFGDNYLIAGAESSLLQILPERGILGFATYVLLFVVLFRSGMKYMPFQLSFFYLMSVAVMEFVTGCQNMAIWCGVYLCVMRMFQLRKEEACIVNAQK